MKNWKLIDFFREGAPESFGRLGSAILIVSGCLIAFLEISFCLYQYAWCDQTIYPIHTGLILELILIGKAGKVAGKWMEKRMDKQDPQQ